MESIATKDYIDLHCIAKRIVNKSTNYMWVIVRDDRYGELMCSIPSTCILYYKLEWNKKYHFQVELSGSTKVGGDGKLYTRNLLTVKRIVKR